VQKRLVITFDTSCIVVVACVCKDLLAPKNIALNKMTWQSSISSNLHDVQNVSSLSNDGSDFTCSVTAADDSHPWWTVDIGQLYYVLSIEMVISDVCE